jgi:hypothetical protein
MQILSSINPPFELLRRAPFGTVLGLIIGMVTTAASLGDRFGALRAEDKLRRRLSAVYRLE